MRAKRGGVKAAIEFIALNDSPADGAEEEVIADYVTSALVSVVFGLSTEEVAKRVARFRRQEEEIERRQRASKGEN